MGFCRGKAYRVLLPSDNKVIESQDVGIFEYHKGPICRSETEKLTELDLSDDGVIFDNQEQFTPDTDSSSGDDQVPPLESSDESSKETEDLDEYPADLDQGALESLTYHPGVKRSERYMAGQLQNLYEYNLACLTKTSGNAKGNVPVMYEESLNGLEFRN